MENKDNAQKGVFFSSLFKKNGKKNETKAKISVVFEISGITLDLDSVVSYAHSQLENGEFQIDEVMILDKQANEQILKTINDAIAKTVKISIDDSFEIVYLLNAKEKSIVKIYGLCVKDMAESLKDELDAKNHIIRLTK